MNILLDTAPFDNPKAQARILDCFLNLKQQIMQALLPIGQEIILSEGFLIIVLTPHRSAIDHSNIESKLSFKITNLIGDKLDIGKIAKEYEITQNN